MIGLDIVVIIVAIICAVVHLARVVTRRAREATARRICVEFAAAFPGKCMICSMHRVELERGYGGFGVSLGVTPHACIEGNSEGDPDVPRATVVQR